MGCFAQFSSFNQTAYTCDMRPLRIYRRHIEERRTELKSAPAGDRAAWPRTGENLSLLRIFCPTPIGSILGSSLFRQGYSQAGPTQSSGMTDKWWALSACSFEKLESRTRAKYSSLRTRVTWPE